MGLPPIFEHIWPLRGWQDFGAAVSSFVSLGLLISIYLGFHQVNSSLRSTKIEKSIDIYMRTTERFAELTSRRSALDRRVSDADVSVHYGFYHDYFVSYWSIQVEQFQYFLAGLIPLDIYVIWMSYLNQKLNGADTYTYFDDSGKRASIDSLAVYERYCKGTSLVNNVEAVRFFEQLRQIRFAGYDAESGSAGAAVAAERQARVTALLKQVRKSRGRKFWIS